MRYGEERSTRQGRKFDKRMKLVLIGSIVVVVIIVLLSLMFGAFGFVMQKVDTQEVGLITKAGRPTELVGPGVYTRWGPFSYYDMEIVDTSGKEFCAEDQEVLTTSENEENPIRIGVKVCGTVFRPGLEIGFAEFAAKFVRYKHLYLNDGPIIGQGSGDTFVEGLVQTRGQQAMKSCIGEGTFFDAAVGQARDATALCHQNALNSLLSQYGFTVDNVTVPNISIPAEVGDALDAVAKAKFDAEAEREQADFVRAQADRIQAEKEGQIRVAQAEIQERFRQDVLTRKLEESAALARLDVIQAEKANELREQELELDVVEAQLLVAAERAKIKNADEAFLVNLYSNSPEYMAYLVELAYAASFGDVDKAFLPVGTTPRMLVDPSGEALITVEPGE